MVTTAVLTRRAAAESMPSRGATTARHAPQVSARHYSTAQWNRMKPIITQLYYEEKKSIAELLTRLHGMGFEVKYVEPFLLASASRMKSTTCDVPVIPAAICRLTFCNLCMCIYSPVLPFLSTHLHPFQSLICLYCHSQRMLHTRIKNWKIGRNHKFSEMRTAAEHLANHQDRQRQPSNPASYPWATAAGMPSPPPSFIVRGEHISYKEFYATSDARRFTTPFIGSRSIAMATSS
jgi:hypothetical protein